MNESTSSSGPQWRIVSPIGPKVAYHASCVFHNKIYIHGGIDKAGSTNPLNKLWCMDLDATIWNEITVPNSPAISHHACVVAADRYIVYTGGWDGKKRTSEVYIFDTQEQKWSHPVTQGFPEGAGLSSHTATLGANGDILLIGREGSLRTQRRHGNAYILTGNLTVLRYIAFPIGVESRSGHTADIIGNNLYVIGGRDDKLVEIHSGYKYGGPESTIMPKLISYAGTLKALPKPPGGRKNHGTASGAGAIFVYGGDTFDGRCREPVGEMYLMKVKPTMTWYKLGVSPLGRTGHSVSVSGDYIVMHGGEGGKDRRINCDTYILEVP